jgi:hypothetical protein
MGCIWIYLGLQDPCKIDHLLDQDMGDNLLEDCKASWIYANDFETTSYTT